MDREEIFVEDKMIQGKPGCLMVSADKTALNLHVKFRALLLNHFVFGFQSCSFQIYDCKSKSTFENGSKIQIQSLSKKKEFFTTFVFDSFDFFKLRSPQGQGSLKKTNILTNPARSHSWPASNNKCCEGR